VLIAHAGVLCGVWYFSRGINGLLLLNALLAAAVLLYAVGRARYIAAALDWPYMGLIVFEISALVAAYLAFRGNASAVICSYVAFGIHAVVSIAAVLFAFTFKMTRLM
jgi:hypothetical protein